MTALSVDDPDRIATLEEYGILDTPAEALFDDIVNLARQICEAPVALVSLVARDRQWFKASEGLEMRETPIEQSVCAHAVEQGSMLVVPDLTQDERTRANPLVTGGPQIRFYAGAPLVAPNGHIIGTLCVIDTVARPQGLDDRQSGALQKLARQVMSNLELRKALQRRDSALQTSRNISRRSLARALDSEAEGDRLRDQEARSAEAQIAAGMGLFEVDVATNFMSVSPEFCRIYGLPEQSGFDVAEIQSLTVSDDHEVMSSASSRAEGAAPKDIQYRIRRSDDGEIRWIARRGEYKRDESSKIVAFIGAVQDITDRKLRELRQVALVRLAETIRDAEETGAIARALSRNLVETLSVDRAGYAAIDIVARTFEVMAEFAPKGRKSLVGTYSLDTFSATLEMARQGLPIAAGDIRSDQLLARDRQAYLAIGAGAQITVPLIRRNVLSGVVFVHNIEPRVWSGEEVGFLHSAAEMANSAMDRLNTEAERELLSRELAHRLKNTLAMVHAIASQTLRNEVSPEALEAFNMRLVTLGRAHDVLTRQSWSAARMREVVDDVLSLHATPDRLKFTGPNINLAPKAVLSMSMLLHELATNAVKYGALSVPEGSLQLDWRTEKNEGDQQFVLRWMELGGPPVVTPTRRGFGSRLIRMGLGGTATANLDYHEDGLVAEFRAPLILITEG